MQVVATDSSHKVLQVKDKKTLGTAADQPQGVYNENDGHAGSVAHSALSAINVWHVPCSSS